VIKNSLLGWIYELTVIKSPWNICRTVANIATMFFLLHQMTAQYTAQDWLCSVVITASDLWSTDWVQVCWVSTWTGDRLCAGKTSWYV